MGIICWQVPIARDGKYARTNALREDRRAIMWLASAYILFAMVKAEISAGLVEDSALEAIGI